MVLHPVIRPTEVTPYLACSEIIDCTSREVRSLARRITRNAHDDRDRAESLFMYVRDSISHSIDSGHSNLVWKASDIIRSGHGLCFGKSHLFVSLCRSLGIPAGLCYQRILKEDGSFVLHGLAAVYLEQSDHWIRLDVRGNKEGINAEFNEDHDQIAYEIHDPAHEWIDRHIYAEPWRSVLSLYETSRSVDEFVKCSASVDKPYQSSSARQKTESLQPICDTGSP